jgi:hypothetical protein
MPKRLSVFVKQFIRDRKANHVRHLPFCVEGQGRGRGAGGGERVVALHIDHEILAVEEREGVFADIVREARLRHVRLLRLSGHDVPAGLLGGLVEHSLGKEDEHCLEQRHEQRQEGRGDQRKFDDSGASIAPQKFTAGAEIAKSLHKRRQHDSILQHDVIADDGALLDLSGDSVK